MNTTKFSLDESGHVIGTIQMAIFILYFIGFEPVVSWPWYLVFLPVLAYSALMITGMVIGMLVALGLFLLYSIKK